MRDEIILPICVVAMWMVAVIALSVCDQPRTPTAIERSAIILPAVGSLWEIKTGDPFPSYGPAIKVLETKSGWVRYYVCSTMPDERCTTEVFLTIYRAVPIAIEVR